MKEIFCTVPGSFAITGKDGGEYVFFADGTFTFVEDGEQDFLSEWKIVEDIIYVRHDPDKDWVKTEGEPNINEALLAEVALRRMLIE